MPETTPKNLILEGAPRAELARLCRQICLARELGKMPPGTADEEFRVALNSVRDTYGTASVSDNDLDDIIAAEESRVADATVLAELISSRLAAILPTVSTTDRAPVRSAATIQTTSSLPTPIPFPSGDTTPHLDVADMIDGMLAQEKRETKTSKKY